MKKLNRTNFNSNRYPERVIQFGEGNFLRAFVDWMIDHANQAGIFQGSVVVVQPIAQGLADKINEQDGLFTVVTRGLQNGKPVVKRNLVSSISRALNAVSEWEQVLACAADPDIDILVSNTTEAGITYVPTDSLEQTPPSSFPGKVCAYLYHRYKTFAGAQDKGMLILPCELIENNGGNLQEIVIKLAEDWKLEAEFIDWIKTANVFCNTLVDRIVTGYPGVEEVAEICAELKYDDQLLTTAEIFHLWVIEAPNGTSARFPLHEAGLNVKWVEDLTPYRTQKVRILNGAHTSSYALSYLAGFDHVREATEDKIVGEFIKSVVFSEIIPTVAMGQDELSEFAAEVIQRFKNPFIQHRWLDISLNAVSKFKARVLPSLLPYLEKEQVPPLLSLAFAGLINFYRGNELTADGLACANFEREYTVRDDRAALEFFDELWRSAGDNYTAVAEQVLSQTDFWGDDLTKYHELVGQIASYLESMNTVGVVKTIEAALEKSSRSVDYVQTY